MMGEEIALADGVGVAETETDQELEKHLKRILESWREVLVHLHSLLLWEKPYYPGIITFYNTLVFMILWYFEPSLLTTLSMIGIIASILDFAVPALSSCVFDSNRWSGVQERQFEEMCQNLIHMKKIIRENYTYLTKIKKTKPKMYFLTVVTGLIFMAWVGNIFSNLLLMYISALTLLLIPGIKHHGILDQFLIVIKDLIAQKAKHS